MSVPSTRTAEPFKLVLSFAPGGNRHDFDGEVGIRIRIAADTTFNQIGLRCALDNTGIHTVNLYEWFSGAVLRTASINLTGGIEGTFYYADIDPITLTTGSYYALLVGVTTSQWWANEGATTVQPSVVTEAVYATYRIGASPFQVTSAGSQFAGVDLAFAEAATAAMPGMPYFAWIDPGETTFLPEHMRWDENIFSFTLAQSEGDPASLTVVVRRPRNVAGDAIGLLGPGRKIWAWFALDCGPDLIRFRGRLVGVPTSLFEELVTLEFVARPIDVVVQKDALAETLRVLPHYDEVVIDKSRRTDPEVVLEGYSKIWHYDRETHTLTVSDEITGEDGLVEFDGASEGGTVLYDGLGLTLTSGPLARVDVKAEFAWTQQARGTVDLTQYLIANWPNEANYAVRGSITSYTFTADNWPKAGAGIGDGWVVAEATASAVYGLDVKSVTEGGGVTVIFPDTSWFGPSKMTTTFTDTMSKLTIPPGSVGSPEQVTQDDWSTTTDGSSLTRSYSGSALLVPLHHTIPTLVAAYTAKRQCTELVSFSLFADVQHVLTDPEDGEALRIDDVKSVNLSEVIGEGTDAYLPIGDPRRRSYIATDRGNRSLEHLIALARAHLMKRARVVEITFAPKLERMPEVTLRKNAFLIEPRVGEAQGKIIGYSVALAGSDGRVSCEVRIGCAIGRGGSAVAAGGTPTYCSVDYAGADYQQFIGQMILFDSSVGYQPPNANPNDDGLDFLSVLTAKDVIATGLAVENPPAVQRAYLGQIMWNGAPVLEGTDQQRQDAISARSEAFSNALKQVETRATFKLKSMSREFSSDYEIQVTDLKIPTGYDLEAA